MSCTTTILSGSHEGRDVTILFEGEGKPCLMSIRYPAFDVDRFDAAYFDNPVKLSASLRCTMGYQFCREFLEAHGIPQTSQLWHLNHERP